MNIIPYLETGFSSGAEHRFSTQIASSGRWGEKIGRGIGTSLEFMDYREYLPGDDLRHIDWNAYGRTDKLIVKQFQDEIRPHLDLVLDTSRSMSITPEKTQATVFILGFYIGAAENSGYSHSIWTLDTVNSLPQFVKTDYKQVLLSAGGNLTFDSTASIGKALLESPPEWGNHTLKIIISDFLWTEDPLAIIRRFGENGPWTACVEVLDNQDIHPDFSGDMRLIDSESNLYAQRRVDSGLINTYLHNLRRHEDLWNSACASIGAARAEYSAQNILSDFKSIAASVPFIG